MLISFYNVSLEFSKIYSKNKSLYFEFRNSTQKKDDKSIYIEPFFNKEYFIYFIKIIFYLNEGKLLFFVKNARNNNSFSIENSLLNESEYYGNIDDLIAFGDNSCKLNTSKTIILKALFKNLIFLGLSGLNIKKFKFLYEFINKICLDYVKLLGDIFTLNIDYKSDYFTEKNINNEVEKKIIVYLSNILELIRLTFKYPETNLEMLIEYRLE